MGINVDKLLETVSYKKALNAYNPDLYPAHKKFTAEEWNALMLSIFAQGNRQEVTLDFLINNQLVNITNKVNEIAVKAASITDIIDIAGSGVVSLSTLNIPTTNISSAEFYQSILDYDIPVAQIIMGGVSFLDMPEDLDYAECTIEVMQGLHGIVKTMTITSEDTAPYQWKYIEGEWVTMGGGAGGVGAGGVTLRTISPLELSVAVGQPAEITFYFKASIGRAGTAKLVIDGVVKKSVTISNGNNSIDITDFVAAKQQSIQVQVSDTAGGTAALTYLVTGIELHLTSSFNDIRAYNSSIDFRYTLFGGGNKTVKFFIDGNLYSTKTIGTTGVVSSESITGLSHGVHKLEVVANIIINNITITSNTLLFNIIFYVADNTTVLISSKFDKTQIIQGEQINIDYIVFDPKNTTTTVELYQNSVLKSTLNVGETKQFWNVGNYEVGNLQLEIRAISQVTSIVSRKYFNIEVLPSSIVIESITNGLELFMTAASRSNYEDENSRNKWTYNSIQSTLTGFNWKTNGWLQDSAGNNILRFNGSAKTTIPFNIFATNFLGYGKTIEIDFSTTNVYDTRKILLSCFSNNKGIQLTSNNFSLQSEQSLAETKFKEDERIRVSFVIQPVASGTKLIKIFINGILSGLVQYSISDDFTQTFPVGITINPNEGDIDIYSIRSYNFDLNDEQILNNYMADLNSFEKTVKYNFNNIIDDYGAVSYGKLSQLLPILIYTGELPVFKGDKKTGSVKYENPFDSTYNFEYDGATIDIQGTSSQYYPKKNWKIKLPEKIIFYPNGVLENTFTFKTDYMESSMSHNTGNAKFLHNNSPIFPTQTNTNGVRNAIYGFPCAIFIKANPNADLVYYGLFNFNNDKGNSATLGLTTPQAQSWEFKNNTSANCLLLSDDLSGTAVPDNFEARYPDGSSLTPELQRVVSWVVSTKNNIAKFKSEFEQYFNKEFSLYYYVMLEFMLTSDSRAKNMYWDTVDGAVWYPRWYDIDTSYGLNNEGVNDYSYGLEQHDRIGDQAVYNGEASLFWNNFEEAFATDIKVYYNNIRSAGKISYDKVMAVLYGEQISKFSESMYNTNAEFKYVSPIIDNNDSTYLYIAQGNRLNHLQWWLSNRIKYMDSKYQFAEYLNDFITMRLYTPAGTLAIEPSGNFEIETMADMYSQVKFGSVDVRQRVFAGETNLLAAPAGVQFNDTETILYGASRITKLGSLANKYAGTMDFSKALKLRELIIGSDKAGYQNTNLRAINIGNNTMLETIDVQNCPNLTTTIDVSGCFNLKKIKAQGTSIPAISLADGGNLQDLSLPKTITNLKILNQPNLTSFYIDGYNNIATIRLENTLSNSSNNIIKLSPNLEKVRLININWSLHNDDGLLNKLMTLAGVDEQDQRTPRAVITGNIFLYYATSLSRLTIYREYFGNNLIINAFQIVPGYVVTFRNYDNTILQSTDVLQGQTAVYTGLMPTKPQDQDYKYAFSGWSIPLTNVQSNLEPIATYTIIEQDVFAFRIATGNSTSERTFQIPTNGRLNNTDNSYNWIIDWGDGSALQTESGIGTSTKGISHTYPSLNTIYNIKIKPLYANELGWLRAFGFYSGNSGASTDSNKKFIKSILVSPTFKMKQVSPSDTHIMAYMFYGCTSLTTAPELPETTLAPNCYQNMFTGCTGLTVAPELPSTILADSCYSSMFYGCTGLTIAPELPATVLGSSCYSSMFYGCTGLTTAPELPETTLAPSCYQNMFTNCTGLTIAPELPATTLTHACYMSMFRGCTGLTIAPELPALAIPSYGYCELFAYCTGLTIAPELPATTMSGQSNYSGMFRGCTGLTTIPKLPAKTTVAFCYMEMFANCTSLKFYSIPDEIYNKPWRVPTVGTGSAGPAWNNQMIIGTTGDVTTIEINTTYYVENEPV